MNQYTLVSLQFRPHPKKILLVRTPRATSVPRPPIVSYFAVDAILTPKLGDETMSSGSAHFCIFGGTV